MGSLTAGELLERAILARKQNRPADAYSDANEAMLLSRADGNQDCLIRALRMLGQIERDEGRPENALPHYQEAVALCRKEGGPFRLAHSVRHLGDLLVQLRRPDEAAREYEAAQGLYRHEPGANPLDLANTLRAIAVMKQGVGDPQAARPFWEEARALYSAVNVEQGVAECDLHLASFRPRHS
jgi:tetratricopeptide (TPR) repeat protein